MVKLPELTLLASTPRRLRGYGTIGTKGNRIEHQLYLALELLHRALQWPLEPLTVRSRIITEFLNDHWRTGGTAGIMTTHRTLQARREVALVLPVHQTSNPKDQGENHTAQHEFET